MNCLHFEKYLKFNGAYLLLLLKITCLSGFPCFFFNPGGIGYLQKGSLSRHNLAFISPYKVVKTAHCGIYRNTLSCYAKENKEERLQP